GHACEVVRHPLLDGLAELLERRAPGSPHVHDDVGPVALAAYADARVPVELALDEARHAGDLLRCIRRVAGDDVGGDPGVAFHQSAADSRTSSVASGLARKRNGTKVVPRPGETCMTVAPVR